MKISCKPFDPVKLYRYAQLKRDGHFTRVIRDVRNGALTVWSSKPLDITAAVLALPQFIGAFNSLPAGGSICGELWQPGKPASAVKTALIDRSKELRFDVFAIDAWPTKLGEHIDAWRLESVQRIVEGMRLRFIPFIVIRDPEHQKFIVDGATRGLAEDLEGYVFKNANLKDWAKYKPRKTIDLIITGYTAGEGKYTGLIGSLHCETREGYPVADCSGMTDIQRHYISQNADKLVGSIVEVEYQSVGTQGRLRHPSFVRLRDDKDSTGCSVNQDPELTAHFAKRETLFN